jgi:hypothetical protein
LVGDDCERVEVHVSAVAGVVSQGDGVVSGVEATGCEFAAAAAGAGPANWPVS